MRLLKGLGWLVVLLVPLAVLALFVLQNGWRTTGLGLNLGFWAGTLAEPVSVPALMGACFGVGLLVGAGGVGIGRVSGRRGTSASDAGAPLGGGGSRADGWR